MNLVSDFAAALRFLTRLGVRRADPHPPAFGAAAFPLVGLLLGGAAVAADTVTGFLPERLRNVEILALWALLTGALHYDGLADTLDALGGGSVEERLRIMRDGAIGTFAVLGLVLVVAAELSALELLHGSDRWKAILLAPALGRWAMLVTAFRAPAAREGGLGAEFTRALEARALAGATLIATATSAVLGGVRGVVLCGVIAGAGAALRRPALTAFGGVTGDVLGASGVAAEALVLVFFAATGR